MRNKVMLLLIVLFAALSAQAQVWRGTGRIAGTAVDPEKKPIAGAKVTVRTEANEGPAIITTDKSGKWAAGGLAAGLWNVDIVAEGFAAKQISVKINEFQRVPPLQVILDRAAAAPAPAAATAPAEEQPKTEIQVGGQTVAPEVAAAIEAGNRFMEQQKYKAAITEYEKAQAALPTNLSLKQALARAYYASGQLGPAIALLKDVYTADPSNVTTSVLYANILLEHGQLPEAKKVLDALPADSVTDSTVMVNVGILFLNKNKPADALVYFNRAVAIDKQRGENYYYRALSKVQLNKQSAAKADLEKFIQLAPDAPEVADARELLKALK